jgi:hypothetical protein
MAGRARAGYNFAVAPRKNSDSTLEPNIAEAAEKASLVIRGLQSRLRPRTPDLVEETPEQLEHQLQQYFERKAPQSGLIGDIRERVVQGVVDQILRQWDNGSALQPEIVERLIDRVIERLAP